MNTENLAIVFVDIAGFTPRTSSQSREENQQMLQRFDTVVRPVVRAFRGRVIKTMGDAFLLTFRSPTDALHCAMAVHDGLAESQRSLPEADRFDVRAAVNVGEVRIDAGDIFGEAVNIAARIESVAPAGEIYFSEAVYLSMTRSEVPSEDLGAHELKGIPEPVRLFRIPRAAEVGGYELGGSSAGAAAPNTTVEEEHPLAPQALPYGGLALAKARTQKGLSVGADALAPALDKLGAATRKLELKERVGRPAGALWQRYRASLRSSRTTQVVSLVVLVCLLALSVWGLWPASKPKKLSPWQKLQRAINAEER